MLRLQSRRIGMISRPTPIVLVAVTPHLLYCHYFMKILFANFLSIILTLYVRRMCRGAQNGCAEYASSIVVQMTDEMKPDCR